VSQVQKIRLLKAISWVGIAVLLAYFAVVLTGFFRLGLTKYAPFWVFSLALATTIISRDLAARTARKGES
jgi:hypothetical protein